MKRAAVALTLAAALGLFLAHVYRYRAYVSDDAYITLRYAQNLIEGHGPYFNPQEHVEGYTNFSLMLLTAAVIAVMGPGAALPFARLLGVTAGAACIALVFVTTHRLLANRRVALPAALTAAGLLAGASGYALNSVNGLETLLFAALVAAGTFLSAYDAGRWPWSALTFGAAALTRPEGVFLFAVFWLARAANTVGRAGAASRRRLVRDAVVVAAIVALHVAFRLHAYDGEWLPNTYWAKAGGAGNTTPLAYVHGSLLPLLGIPGVIAGLLGALLEDRRARAPLAATGAAAACLPFLTGPDWMPGGRLLIPALVLLAPMVVVGWATLLERTSPRLAVAVPLLLVPSLWLQAPSRDVYAKVAAARSAGERVASRPLADALCAAARPGDVAALTDIGLVGFTCPSLRILDVSGLIDRHIAKSPGRFLNKQYDVGYVYDRAPRFLVIGLYAEGGVGDPLSADARLRFWQPIEAAIAQDPRFAREYTRPVPSSPAPADARDWKSAVAAHIGAWRVFEYPLPAGRYLLAVYERAADAR
jgi:hypothetical protein